MLLTLATSLISYGSSYVHAAVTEAGGNDFCYTGNGDDGVTGINAKDKVDTIPITISDESKTGKAAMKEIADAIGEKLNIKPALVYAQMCQEAGPNGDSQEAVKDKNFSGIKGSGGGIPSDGTGGQYQHFNSLSEYASRYAAILKNDGLSGVQDPADYVHRLKMMKYFTASEDSYLAGVKALMAGYYGSDASQAGQAAGAAGEDAIGGGSWHRGDNSFAPNSLNTTFTTGFGGGEEQQAEDDEDNAAAANSANGNWRDKNSPNYKNAKKIFNRLTKKRGWSGAGAASALGNFAIESGFNPQASNGTHFGLAQWSQDRLNAMNLRGYDNTTLTFDNEMKLMDKELSSSYKNVNDKVGHATSVQQGTVDFDSMYEQSGGASDDQRISAAIWFYQQFDGASIDANDSLLGSASEAADAAMANNTSTKSSGACSGQENSSGDWTWPFKDVPKSGPTGYEDGQQFGQTSMARGIGHFHDGYDWGSARYHGDILAVHGGTVYKIANAGARGWHIDVKSSDGYYETYQEFTSSRSDIKVSEGDQIQAGQPIAHLSSSHLHLGISRTEIEKAQSSWDRDDGTWLDPIKVIKGENIDQK